MVFLPPKSLIWDYSDTLLALLKGQKKVGKRRKKGLQKGFKKVPLKVHEMRCAIAIAA